jgi:hypothetical protein
MYYTSTTYAQLAETYGYYSEHLSHLRSAHPLQISW